jgi:hypothetical protein
MNRCSASMFVECILAVVLVVPGHWKEFTVNYGRIDNH